MYGYLVVPIYNITVHRWFMIILINAIHPMEYKLNANINYLLNKIQSCACYIGFPLM